MVKAYGLFLSLFMCLFVTHAGAINVRTDVRSWWGYDGSTATNGGAQDFIIAGSTGKSGAHGTHADEWGVIGMVAETIVEHGGYFCPYQIQCANKRKKRRTWTVYYQPGGALTNFSSKCVWLCESGYAGVGCLPQNEPARCDKTPMNTASGGKFAGFSMKTYGGDEGNRENYVTGFNQWGSDPEHDVVLGIIKYLEHGVMAGPVQIKCGRDNWKSIDSFVASVLMAPGNIKLLCAEGYKADANGTDCVPINPDRCATQDMTFCANFDRTKYDSSIHSLQTDGNCVKYFCAEDGMTFASNVDTSCVPCSTGVKGGANTINGLCVKCGSGEYFDKASNSCKSAAAYSKTDLQYGKGETKATQPDFDKQCWTYVEPGQYKSCVESSGENIVSVND